RTGLGSARAARVATSAWSTAMARANSAARAPVPTIAYRVVTLEKVLQRFAENHAGAWTFHTPRARSEPGTSLIKRFPDPRTQQIRDQKPLTPLATVCINGCHP